MDGTKRLPALQRRRDADRVELAAGMGLEVFKGRFEGPGLLVGALAGEGVKHIRHRDDAGFQGDRLPRQSFRVALTVETLMVVGDDVLQHVGVMDAVEAELADHQGDHLPPLEGVGLHHPVLLGRELARLEQDGVGHRNLADIVQLGEEVNELHLLVTQGVMGRHLPGDEPRIGRHPVQVIGGLLVPVAAELPHRGQGPVQGLDGEELHRDDGRQDLGIGRQLTANGAFEVTGLFGIAKQKAEQATVEQQRLGIARRVTGRQHFAAVLGGGAQQGIQGIEHPGLLVLGQVAQGRHLAQPDLVLQQRRAPVRAVGKGLELVRLRVVDGDRHPAQLVKPLPEGGVHVLHFLTK